MKVAKYLMLKDEIIGVDIEVKIRRPVLRERFVRCKVKRRKCHDVVTKEIKMVELSGKPPRKSFEHQLQSGTLLFMFYLELVLTGA